LTFVIDEVEVGTGKKKPLEQKYFSDIYQLKPDKDKNDMSFIVDGHRFS
jgi:hypothetical protein